MSCQAINSGKAWVGKPRGLLILTLYVSTYPLLPLEKLPVSILLSVSRNNDVRKQGSEKIIGSMLTRKCNTTRAFVVRKVTCLNLTCTSSFTGYDPIKRAIIEELYVSAFTLEEGVGVLSEPVSKLRCPNQARVNCTEGSEILQTHVV